MSYDYDYDYDYDVFVSYRRVSPDQDWVREQLVPGLRAAGLKVLLDVEDFVPGRNLILEMTRAGEESRKVLCVLSPEYFESGRMVYFESLAALGSHPAGEGARLIPLIIRSTELPAWLRNRVAVDWTCADKRESEWRKLLKALGADLADGSLKTALAALPAALPARVIANNLPRRQYFVGRDHELAMIAKALAVETRGWGVLISGAGGIGKTALAIRAAELAPTPGPPHSNSIVARSILRRRRIRLGTENYAKGL